MQVVSRTLLLAVLIVGSAHAEPSQAYERSVQSVAPPPAPPELAPLNPDFQAAMANSQLATYRYTQLTEQALALKKLCDTGFGPADICPRGNEPGRQAGAAPTATDLPTVTGITGGRAGFAATLLLGDGRRVSVHSGSRLPDGSAVAGISGEDVRVDRAGIGEIVLPFAGAELK